VSASHGFVNRHIMGCSAFCVTFGITASSTLSREVFRTFRQDDYRTGLARLAWYARRRFPRLDMSTDPLHLFCAGMQTHELDAMRAFLSRQSGHLAPEVLLGELSVTSAIVAQETFGTPRYASDIARLRGDAGALLEHGLRKLSRGEEPPRGDQLYPEPRPRRQALEGSKAEEALRDTVKLLEAEGFRPFILSGTLLGAVREGGILEHDYDIDLGLIAEETDLMRLEEVLRHAADFRDLRKEYQSLIVDDPQGQRRDDIPVVYKISHNNGGTVDIFLHYSEGGAIWHGTTLYRWSNSPFTLSPRHLAGIRVLAPANAEQNLAENYGDWQKPKYAFHCALDTPNLVLHRGTLALAVAVRRLAMLYKRPEDAARLIAQMEAAEFIEQTEPSGWRVQETAFAPVS